MCEVCKENELENIEEQELEELSSDCNDYVLPFLNIPFEVYDADEFARGMQEYSFLAGALSAIVNVGGISGDSALNYIMNKEILENALKISEITKEMNIEMSKNQALNVDKNQL